MESSVIKPAKSKTFYVTTAIDYVNAEPHVGHMYQKVIADVLYRWNKITLGGKNSYFLTGTDEHGKKIYEYAEKAGKKPQEFVNEMSAKFKEAWNLMDIHPNRFIRTTDEDHKKIVQEMIKKCKENGDIYLSEYEGLYCTGCEAYYTEKDLIDGNCPIHKKPVEKIKEKSYFFKLSKYQNYLLELYKKHPEFILPEERRNEIINRVKEGLKDLSISRTSFDWGIPFPGDKEHVIYVWFDALFNYYTGSGKNHEHWPATIHLLGKDNAWFHAVYWPAFLKSVGLKFPKTIFVHGFLTFNGQKISKSLGDIISPIYLSKKYSSDVVRYFVCRNFPFAEGNDGDFSENVLIERNNSELADKLGNLVSRVAGLIEKNKDSPGKIKKDIIDKKLFSKLNLKKIIECYNNYEIDKALNEIFAFIDGCNLYIQKNEPWKLEGKKLNKILYNASDAIRIISLLLSPVIPKNTKRINEIFGFDNKLNSIKDAKPGIYSPKKEKEIKKEVLFIKIENKNKKEDNVKIKSEIKSEIKIQIQNNNQNNIQKMKTENKEKGKTQETKTQEKKEEKFEGIAPLSEIKYEDFAKVDMRIAKVLNVKEHPNADKLLVLDIDLGFEKRTLVAGLKQHYKPEQLIGKKIVVLANLEPKELRGIISKGMILAATTPDKNIVSVLFPEKDIPVGSKLS